MKLLHNDKMLRAMLRGQEYTALARATIACLQEIKDRSTDIPSAFDSLDMPHEGTLKEIIEFEQTDAFQEAMRQDQMNDVFELEIDAVIANLEGQL